MTIKIWEYICQDLQYLRRDLEHIFYNLPLSLVALLFYYKFGFEAYGWSHVVLLICWTFLIYSMDDWLDDYNTRKLPPFYNFLLLIIALIISPVIIITSMVGLVLINIRALLKKSNFWLEEVESISEMLVFIPIYFYPLGTRFPFSYLEAIPVVYIIDKIHKLGHSETINRRKTMKHTFIVALLIFIITLYHSENLPLLFAIIIILTLFCIPVIFAETQNKGWYAFQMWQSFAVPIIVYYVLFYVWHLKIFRLPSL